MKMKKGNFVALANAIREHNAASAKNGYAPAFTLDHLNTLASFCKRQNGEFKQDQWLASITGEYGKDQGTK